MNRILLLVASLTLAVPAILVPAMFVPAAAAAESSLGVALELGPAWFSRNDIRIPGDGGTEFDMLRLTGKGPDFFLRAEGAWDPNDRHGLRLVLAPLEVSGTGPLAEETLFDDTTFAPGPTRGTYRFSTYKLTYRYTIHGGDTWRWRVGFTGLIRDAEVALRQGPTSASYDNVGFVPLLHVSGDYRLNDRWGLSLDFDGLAGGPGRAFDVAVQANYRLTDRWQLGAGYRTLEGGADTDDVYSFGWIHYGVLSVAYRL